ncbi:NIPSNAP family protein [Shewanella psychropiezotolerans]|uniref:NIPSNAP family protein n=1 Tax=Shewanella psychropiezotolerans TaxID=2593655 RepID=A0ABX5X0U2_9GAMM|nr:MULTISPECIES: NIPSNAP family protein [Shewanella]MPY21386.1 NIPSNAP family protein [Shewanella sp. YLB-07]MPY22173.1 NIPSNAP family protein [Shewanella sp. YLB-07]QDO84975.1 NIPSNAP family protein [Shewanella psychropiezotolerans]
MTSNENLEHPRMQVTCHVRYVINPEMIEEFEHYAKLWIPLVEKFGGQHHGYFLPGEGANDIAIALFSFPSLAVYEIYRNDSAKDADCLAAFDFAKKHKFILRYERNFMRPVLG